jgi:foldase protein PrsA
MRPLHLLLAPVLVVTPLAAGCGHDAPAVPASAIAVVGRDTIERSQLDALMADARESYATSGRSFPAAGTKAYDDLRRTAVRLLVEQAVLEQEAPGLGVEVGDDQVDARLQRLKEEAFGGSDARYRARLRQAGMTDSEVRDALRAQLLAQSVRQAVTENVTVGTPAVKAYYEAHLSSYSTPAVRTIRDILVATEPLAASIDVRVRSGASFAALARRLSRDLATRGAGGALRLVAGRTRPDLDRVAFSLATGAVSDPFRTRFGWELVQAVSPARPALTAPFAAVSDAIRLRLLAAARARAFQSWLAGAEATYASRTRYANGFGSGGG